jgi:hypothetical protein
MTVFAVGTIAAGVFRPDPMFGFPRGAPPGAPDHPSWHSNLHFAVASLALLALIGASLVIARGFAAHGRTGWAASSATVGVVVLGATVVQAAAANHGPVNAIFLVAILLGYGWASALAAWLRAQLPSAPPA